MKINITKIVIYMSACTIWSFIFSFLSVTMIFADDSSAQDIRDVVITVEFVDATLQDTFEEIEAKTEFTFLYNKSLVESSKQRINIRRKTASVENILRDISRQTGVGFRQNNGSIAVKFPNEPPSISKRIAVGTITGTVTDAETGEPLAGANVGIKGTSLGSSTDENGQFRIEDVETGSYTLVASFVGYKKTLKEVTVMADKVIKVDFGLQTSASELDEVVVTGSIVGTELKKMGTSVSIVKEMELERINPTSVQDIFSAGRIPGVSSLDLGADADFNQAIRIRGSNATLPQISQTKILVDGIEANAQFLSLIGAQNIERVEVIRGPQASTLYGAEASGGVIQLFTKKGGAQEGEKLQFSTKQGVIQSKYVSSTPLNHQYSASLSGGLGGGSYHIAGGYQTKDGYIPNFNRKITNLSAGMRRKIGSTFELSIIGRYFNKKFGSPGSAGVWYGLFQEDRLPSSQSIDSNDYYKMRAIKLGARASYAPFSWWEHNLTLGAGFERTRSFGIPDPNVPDDTTNSTRITDYTRPTLRYTTTLKSPKVGILKGVLTLGFEYVEPQRITTDNTYPATGEPSVQTLPGGSVWESDLVRRGYFGQLRIDVRDQLFVTVGLRTDYNTNFGPEFGNYSTNPRIGVSALIEPISGWTIKPRASWGTGIQAPTLRMIAGGAPFALPNPEIGPQTTTGWEVGADQYFTALGGDWILQSTYYSQTTEDLISTDYVEYPFPFFYLNAGKLSNKGLELAVEYSTFPLTVRANVSFNNNKIISIPEVESPINQVGKPVARPPVPKNTAGLLASYDASRLLGLPSRSSASVSLFVSRVGERWAWDWGSIYDGLSDGTFTGTFADYFRWFDGLTKANINLNYRINEMIGLNLSVNNLFNSYRQETPYYVTPGRQITVGVQVNPIQ